MLWNDTSPRLDLHDDPRLDDEVRAVVPDVLTVELDLERNLPPDAEAGVLQQDHERIYVDGFQKSEPLLRMNGIERTQDCRPGFPME